MCIGITLSVAHSTLPLPTKIWCCPMRETVHTVFDVVTTGQRDGVEVAQIYINGLYNSVNVPVTQLIIYEQIVLHLEETRHLTFSIV
jgi:hypothetical protein